MALKSSCFLASFAVATQRLTSLPNGDRGEENTSQRQADRSWQGKGNFSITPTVKNVLQQLDLNTKYHYQITMVVTILVADYTALYEHIKRPHLDKLILSEEFSGDRELLTAVSINTLSDGESYALKAHALYSDEKVNKALVAVRKGLEAKFRITDDFDDSFVVASPFVTGSQVQKRFAAGLGEYGVEVMYLQSCIWILGGTGLMNLTVPRKIEGQEPFVSDFNFFKAVFQTAMTSIYTTYNSGKVPDLTLEVKVGQK